MKRCPFLLFYVLLIWFIASLPGQLKANVNDFTFYKNITLIPLRISTSVDTTISIVNNGATKYFVDKVEFANNNDYTVVSHDKDAIDTYQTLSIVVNFKPEKEFGQNNTLLVIFKNKDTLKINLSGYGYIPKISVNDYHFTYQKVLTRSKMNYFVIKNPSQSSDLLVEKISIKTNANFTFDDDSFVKQNITVPKGGETQVGIIFYPKAEGSFKVKMQVISDAEPGPDRMPRHYDTLELSGSSLKATTELDLGTLSICDLADTVIGIDNISLDKNLSIDSIKVDDPLFVKYNVLDTAVAPGYAAFVKILVGAKVSGKYNSTIYVYTNIGILSIPLNIEFTQSDTKLSIGDYSQGKSITKPGDQITIPIYVKYEPGKGLDSAAILVHYDPRIIVPYAVDDSAKMSIVDNGLALIKIKIKTAGLNDTLNLSCNTYLSDTLITNVWIETDFPENYNCYKYSQNEKNVVFNVCTENIRCIETGQADYAFEKISPNPINGDKVHIVYSMPFKAPAKITFYNSNGQIKKVLDFISLPVGKNELELNIGDFDNGLYFVEFTSYSFTKVQKMILIK